MGLQMSGMSIQEEEARGSTWEGGKMENSVWMPEVGATSRPPGGMSSGRIEGAWSSQQLGRKPYPFLLFLCPSLGVSFLGLLWERSSSPLLPQC